MTVTASSGLRVVLVREGQVVREHVVPGVAQLREEPVADAQRRRRGQHGGDEGEGGRGEQGGAQAGGRVSCIHHRLPARRAHGRDGARRAHPNGGLRAAVSRSAAGCWARLTSYTPGTSRIARIRAGSPAASGSCRV